MFVCLPLLSVSAFCSSISPHFLTTSSMVVCVCTTFRSHPVLLKGLKPVCRRPVPCSPLFHHTYNPARTAIGGWLYVVPQWGVGLSLVLIRGLPPPSTPRLPGCLSFPLFTLHLPRATSRFLPPHRLPPPPISFPPITLPPPVPRVYSPPFSFPPSLFPRLVALLPRSGLPFFRAHVFKCPIPRCTSPTLPSACTFSSPFFSHPVSFIAPRIPQCFPHPVATRIDSLVSSSALPLVFSRHLLPPYSLISSLPLTHVPLSLFVTWTLVLSPRLPSALGS